MRLGTAAAKIKSWERDDVLLAVFDPGTTAAGVFTQNRFCAAPVIVCRQHLAGAGRLRALVVNAGNANAGTGAAGIAAAESTCAAVASMLDCAPGEVLPFSTGVIMEPLPVEKIVAALPRAFDALAPDHWFEAVSAIMTTDTVPKGASRRIAIDGVPVTVTGIAKGSGMIHPDMATMLAFVATDAPLAAGLLATATREIAAVSFNCATIDGDTSTNDSFVLAATGNARRWRRSPTPTIRAFRRFAPRFWRWPRNSRRRSSATARAQPSSSPCESTVDAMSRNAGESHSPSPTRRSSRRRSSRRIRISAGSSARSATRPWPISTRRACPSGSTTCAWSRTAHAPPSYTEEAGQRVMKNDEIVVRVTLGRGDASATVWTCDFSHDYVSINADYRS